jgi:hypothetical protein
MNSEAYSFKISNLSRLLTKVHRSLLDFQKKIHEGLEERRLSAQDTLHLAIHHPDFEWLRKISVLISQMDEVVDDKKNPATEDSLKKFSKQLRELFVDDSQHNNFRTRLDIALAKDPTLCLEIAELRSALGRLP